MTINERTSLLPKEYQKTYIIPIPQDDENNNISNNNNNMNDNGVLREYDSCALSKDELNKYIDDPWWIKMRYGCCVFYWTVCLIALTISLYIAADALQHDHCGANGAANQTQTTSFISEATGSPLDIGSTTATTTTLVFPLLTQQAT